jgi:sugar phosphate isomerase/epimerase
MRPLPTDRRQFLRTGFAAAVGMSFPGVLRADDKQDPFGGFVVGVQSYTFRKFPLEQMLKRTQDLGLKVAEFYNGHISPNSTPDQIKAALRLCNEYGVKPVAFGVEGFSKNHDANKKKFEFGKALGINYLSADPDPDSFDSLDKLVDEYKIAIAIHPHGPAGGGKLHRWYSAEVIMKAVKDHHKLIGSCLDTGHLIRSAQLGEKLDPAQQVRVMGERNYGLHLKDHDNTRKTDVPLGKASLDLVALLKALKEVKFAGSLSIEYEASENEPSPEVKECVALFREAAGKIS